MIKLLDRPGFETYDDLEFVTAKGAKADLIEGVIYVTPPDNTEANDLSFLLYTVIREYCEHFDLGKVYASRVAFKLDKKNGPEPDIAVVLTPHLDRVKRNHVAGPADLAMEIVSPESIDRDYVKKRKQYETFGFPEYWIVDEEVRKVTLLRLEGSTYKEVRPTKGVLVSKVLPGFWLRPEWVWMKPRPKTLVLLAEILAGVPK
jgi:Uma2 family endonuclease